MPERTELLMYATIFLIVAISVLVIVYKIIDDHRWRKLLRVGIADIVEYGEQENYFLDQFALGWVKRKHPDLTIKCPEDWRRSEDKIVEALRVMQRDSLISRVEIYFVGNKFDVEVSARNW